jgi:hypothetical protein
MKSLRSKILDNLAMIGTVAVVRSFRLSSNYKLKLSASLLRVRRNNSCPQPERTNRHTNSVSAGGLSSHANLYQVNVGNLMTEQAH